MVMNSRDRGFLEPAGSILLFLVVGWSNASSQDWAVRGACTSITLEAVSFSDAQNAFAVGQDSFHGYVLHSGNGGSSWAPLLTDSHTFYDVEFGGGSLGLAVGDGGYILRSTDGGQSWSQVVTNTTGDLRTVA